MCISNHIIQLAEVVRQHTHTHIDGLREIEPSHGAKVPNQKKNMLRTRTHEWLKTKRRRNERKKNKNETKE